MASYSIRCGFRFVNRENELNTLIDTIRYCGLVIVYSSKRIGKTRLLYELSKRIDYRVLISPMY